MQVKLPKQWKHWCASAGLRQRSRKYDKRKIHTWFYLHGHGREWRVNCHSMLQCGDTYADFDRWALCDIKEVALPKTKDSFVQAVRYLVEAQK